MRSRRFRIEIGDTFKKVDATSWVWLVVDIFQPKGHRLHARLIRRGAREDCRVFSLAALQDRRLFVPSKEKAWHDGKRAPLPNEPTCEERPTPPDAARTAA